MAELKNLVNLLHKAEGDLRRAAMTTASAMCVAREAGRGELFHRLADTADALGDAADRLAEDAYVLLDEVCSVKDEAAPAVALPAPSPCPEGRDRRF
jgi:hypothetical protein